MKKILLVTTFLLLLKPGLQSQTFSSTVQQIIPDDGTIVSFDIQVSGLPNTIDTLFGLESVCLNITHTYVSDLTVKIQAPNGKVIMLFGGIGGDGDNFTGTCVGGTGTPITVAAPPYTGSFQSQGILGNINKGQDPNGTWTIILHDNYPQDEGVLIDWSITFGNHPAHPFNYVSSNLPIVKLTTIADPIGDEPKVPVWMQIIDNGPGQRNDVQQTDYAYEGPIMVEWQGFTGPYYPKKNYDFELKDLAGNDLDTSILGLPKESDWLFKAEYLDHTLIKNSITYEMARRMGVYAPRTRPCELVLDGEYIGLYVLTEKVKRGKNRVNIAKLSESDTTGSALTGGYIFEMNINNAPGDWNSPYPPINDATCDWPVEFKHVYPNSERIMPQQRDYLRAYVDTFENSLLAPDFAEPAGGYRRYMDVKSFIDFLIVNEFSVNYDSYGRSTYLYKEKDTNGGKLKIGPPWDYDRALDYYSPLSSSGWVWEITHPYWPFPFWWSKMWEDERYRKELACRWLSLRQNTLSNQAFSALVDSLHTLIDESQRRNFVIWNDLGADSYADNIDSLHHFLDRRLQWMDETLAAEQVSLPAIPAVLDTALCSGVLFDAAAVLGNQFLYNWQPGPDSAQILFPESGLYRLKVSDELGCYAYTTFHVDLSQPDAGFQANQVGSSGSSTWQFEPNFDAGAQYLWYFGDGNGSTEKSPQHSFAASGAYTVSLIVTDSHGCSAESQQNIQFTSGTSDPGLIGARIYPNPFQDQIQVELHHPLQGDAVLRLENQLGENLHSAVLPAGAVQGRLVAPQLPPGVYTLRLSVSSATYSLKMVKN